jgi:rubrerythrin
MAKKRRFIEGLRRAWREENASAAIYRAMTERERDPNRRSIFARMAAEEEKHARRWEERLRELGAAFGVVSGVAGATRTWRRNPRRRFAMFIGLGEAAITYVIGLLVAPALG